jgi:hypothetical protein
MLGYTDIDGRHYYVRQMKNLKASIPVEWLTGASFNFYAWACGALLARAHARVGDAAHIAGYCGNSAVLDKALAEWAESYGDQTGRITPHWLTPSSEVRPKRTSRRQMKANSVSEA